MSIRRYKTGNHPYHSYHSRSFDRHMVTKKKKWPFVLLLLVGCIGAYVMWRITAPLPEIKTSVVYRASSAPQPQAFMWPENGESAIAIEGQGVVAQKNQQETVQPIASTAKLITALAILEKKPLKINEKGPVITLNQADVDIFNSYYVRDGSTTAVAADLELSEYQMLQGILISSSNNYADSMAIWAFGSLEKYRTFAQQYVRSIGAKQTTIGEDASGFSPTTTSTTYDLALIGLAASRHPVIQQIMAQPSVELPVAGRKNNTNWSLGESGIIGGKTGNTNEANGMFVAIAKHTVAKQPVKIVVAIKGAPTVDEAIRQAQDILEKNNSYIRFETIIPTSTPLIRIKSHWGQQATGQLSKHLQDIVWNNQKADVLVQQRPLKAPLKTGDIVGQVRYKSIQKPIVVDTAITHPSLWWKISQPIW